VQNQWSAFFNPINFKFKYKIIFVEMFKSQRQYLSEPNMDISPLMKKPSARRKNG
jgi:hypothetical protein